MAAAACEHSDRVIFTSDNPDESQNRLSEVMEEGLAPAYGKYISITKPEKRD